MEPRLLRNSPYLRFPLPLWLLFFILAGLGILSPNPLLTPLSILSLPVFARLLWRRGEPPVLFFVVAFQWLEVTMRVFHADVLGFSVSEQPLEGVRILSSIPEVKEAILLGLAGLFVLAMGMRIATVRLPAIEAERLQEDAMRLSLEKIWIGYVISIVIALGLIGLGNKIYPLRQFFQVLASFRWIMFFILAYAVFFKKRGRLYLLLASLFEIAMGFTAYFAGFTYVLFILFLASSAVGYRFRLGNAFKITLIAGACLFLATFWMTVREEYRSFLSAGERAQIIVVPVRARFEKLIELAQGVRGEDLRRGFEALLVRISYVDMFAYVLRNVPRFAPHEGGKLWQRAFQHIVTPRVFFPDKPVLGSDSEMTMKYTLLYMAGEAQGTSVSMGYMAESYIDFGRYGMFVPIFLLGFLWGFFFRFLVSKTNPRIFGYALSLVVLITAMGFGSTNAKLLGGVVTGFLVMAFASKVIAQPLSRTLLISSR